MDGENSLSDEHEHRSDCMSFFQGYSVFTLFLDDQVSPKAVRSQYADSTGHPNNLRLSRPK
jgi:hypothetical protein